MKLPIPIRSLSTFLPSGQVTTNLFIAGATVGPIVDSLHNQCLLKYNVAPIQIEWPSFLLDKTTSSTTTKIESFFLFHQNEYLFASSWTVPLLLGVAYVVLGCALPLLIQNFIDVIGEKIIPDNTAGTLQKLWSYPINVSKSTLRNKAVLAVISTAIIIKFSEYLVLNPFVFDDIFSKITDVPEHQHLILLSLATFLQWLVLDGTLTALLAGLITSVGGPLSELPFIAAGIWTYLPQVSDKMPLMDVSANDSVGVTAILNDTLIILLGDGYHELALSSVSAPCYFAVTMDAIALGRWFSKNDDGV